MSEFNFNPSFNFTPGGSGFNPGMDFNPAATTDFNPSEAAFDISKFEKDIEAPKQQQKQPPKPQARIFKDQLTGLNYDSVMECYMEPGTNKYIQFNYDTGEWEYVEDEDKFGFDPEAELLKSTQLHADPQKQRKKKKPAVNVPTLAAQPIRPKVIPVEPPQDKPALIAKLRAQSTTSEEMKLYEPDNTREPVNIVFIGHVDAGKSTTCGRILLDTGKIDERTVAKYEEEAKEKGRESWWLAYILDLNEDERAKGKTVEVGKAYFETPTKRFTILDAPGHKSYVPNMIAGACQADYAALVISARIGEFETGFEKGGQTQEHAMLVKSLGTSKLIVLVNKMDDPSVQWAEERYNQIRNDLMPFFINQAKFNEEDILWIPVSGLTGLNITRPVDPQECSWYQGPTFLELVDAIPQAPRDQEALLCLPILDKNREQGLNIMGKVENGLIVKNMRCFIMPDCIKAEVQEIFGPEDIKYMYAGPGENVKVKLKLPEGAEILRGYVVSDIHAKLPTAMEFYVDLQLLDLLDHKPLVTAGYECILHLHTAIENCVITEVKGIWNQEKKKWERGRFGKTNSRLIVKIKLENLITVAKYSSIQQIGRLTIRDEDRTIGVGYVTRLEQVEEVQKKQVEEVKQVEKVEEKKEEVKEEKKVMSFEDQRKAEVEAFLPN